MAVQATPLKPGDPLPTALQPANVALAEVVRGVQALTAALRNKQAAAKALTGAVAAGALSLRDLAGRLGQFRNLSGLAFNQLHQLTGAIRSTVASFVEAYNPTAVRLFNLTVRDLTATVGEILLPTLRKLEVVVRGVADTLNSLSPPARAMIAALAVASVSMVTLTAATEAFAVAVAGATGGLSLVAGALAGAAAGLGSIAFQFKSLDGVKEVVRQVTVVAKQLFDVVGEGFARFAAAVQPVLAAVGDLAGQLAGGFVAVARTMVDTAVGLVTQLLPVVRAVLPAVAQLGAALVGMQTGLVRVAAAALTPLLGVLQLLAPAVSLMLTPVTALAQVVGAVANVVGSVLAPALELATTPLRLVAQLFAALTAEVQGAVGDLAGALAEVGTLVGEVVGLLRQLFAELGEDLRPVFDAVRDFAANVLRTMTDHVRTLVGWVRDFVALVRELLGIEQRGPDVPGGSQGKAVANVRFSSTQDMLKELQKAAFAAAPGRPTDDPARQAVGHLQAIRTDVEAIRRRMEQGQRLAGVASPITNAPTVQRKVRETAGSSLDWLRSKMSFGD